MTWLLVTAGNRPSWIKSPPSSRCCDFSPNNNCQRRARSVPAVLTDQHAHVSWNCSGNIWRCVETEPPDPRSALVSQKAFCIFIMSHRCYDSTGRPWGRWCARSHMLRHEIKSSISYRQSAAELARKLGSPASQSHAFIVKSLSSFSWISRLHSQHCSFSVPHRNTRTGLHRLSATLSLLGCNWFGVGWWCNITRMESVGEVYGHSVKKKKRWEGSIEEWEVQCVVFEFWGLKLWCFEGEKLVDVLGMEKSVLPALAPCSCSACPWQLVHALKNLQSLCPALVSL